MKLTRRIYILILIKIKFLEEIMEQIINTGLANYYGVVEVYYDDYDNKYYLTLENYDHSNGVEISESLAMALREEFKEEKELIGLSIWIKTDKINKLI